TSFVAYSDRYSEALSEGTKQDPADLAAFGSPRYNEIRAIQPCATSVAATIHTLEEIVNASARLRNGWQPCSGILPFWGGQTEVSESEYTSLRSILQSSNFAIVPGVSQGMTGILQPTSRSRK